MRVQRCLLKTKKRNLVKYVDMRNQKSKDPANNLSIMKTKFHNFCSSTLQALLFPLLKIYDRKFKLESNIFNKTILSSIRVVMVERVTTCVGGVFVLHMLISHGVREVQNIHIKAEKDYKEALKKNVKEEEEEEEGRRK